MINNISFNWEQALFVGTCVYYVWNSHMHTWGRAKSFTTEKTQKKPHCRNVFGNKRRYVHRVLAKQHNKTATCKSQQRPWMCSFYTNTKKAVAKQLEVNSRRWPSIVTVSLCESFLKKLRGSVFEDRLNYDNNDPTMHVSMTCCIHYAGVTTPDQTMMVTWCLWPVAFVMSGVNSSRRTD